MENKKIRLRGLGLMAAGVCTICVAGLEGSPIHGSSYYFFIGAVCLFAGAAHWIAGFLGKEK